MRLFLLLIVLGFSTTSALSQKSILGVFGAKNIFTFSARVSPTYIRYAKAPKEFEPYHQFSSLQQGEYKLKPRVFDLGLYVAYDRIITRKSVIGISYLFDPIVATTHGTYVIDGWNNDKFILADQRFYNHQIQLNYKLYVNENIAGLGFYLKFGAGVSYVISAKDDYLMSDRSYGLPDFPSSNKKDFVVFDTIASPAASGFNTVAGVFEFAVGWNTPITKWLAFNFELGTTATIGYGNYNDEMKWFYGFEGMFSRYNTPYSYGIEGTELERDLESFIRADSNRKNLLHFKLGFNIMI